ncbi:MAG: type II secretion system F family protein [Candidatus Neomarinimicrobiota bacterium]
MAEFKCKMISEEGTVFETVVEAESPFEIYEMAELRNEGVLTVEKYKKPFSLQSTLNSFQKIKPQELEDFTSQLVVMLKAGVPLIDSLKTIVDTLTTERLRNIINEVIEAVEGGKSFSKALEPYPKVFDTLYVNMVMVGETTGVLDVILAHLRGFIHHDIAVRRKIKSAMRYPLIVISVLLIAFVGAVGFIIPRFADLFNNANVALPLPTQIMIVLSKAVTDYWFITISIVGLIIFTIRYYISKPAGAYRFDRLKLVFPVFKHIVLESSLARFAHILETLNRSGIKIIRALEITEQTIENRVISREIGVAREKVIEGVSLAESLSGSKHFPKTMLMMLSVGEESGALDAMLLNISEQYDTSVNMRIEGLSAAIEPMLTIGIGGFLLLFALSIFLPMWRITDVVRA